MNPSEFVRKEEEHAERELELLELRRRVDELKAQIDAVPEGMWAESEPRSISTDK